MPSRKTNADMGPVVLVFAMGCVCVPSVARMATGEAATGDAPRVSVGRDDGYRGIWYANQPSNDEYKYKYSGGLGTYCAKHIPMAYYSAEADKTFFCYGGTAKGERRLLEMVSYYDHATGTVPRPTILMDKQTADAHDNPVIMLDGDGYVWVFASAHGTARPAYMFKSDKPYSVDSFRSVRQTNFSYPQPWHLANRGFLFLHTEYVGRCRFLYWMTSRDGVDWSEPQLLSRIARGHYQISWPHKNTIGTAFNYHPEKGGLNRRTNLYYVQSDDFGQTWRSATGARVDVPLTTVTNPALVHDYEFEGLLVYLKDINYDAQGRPIILYLTSRGYQAGPANDPRTWTVANWTGRRWDIHPAMFSDNNYDTGCLHVEADGTWRIIGPTEHGPQPYNPGGEIGCWISRDKGRNWSKQHSVTSHSRFNHTYVRRPVNAHPDFYAFWADGHGRKPSESRLYFCDRSGQRVFRLPPVMRKAFERPQPVQ